MGTDVHMYIEQNLPVKYGAEERHWVSRDVRSIDGRLLRVYSSRSYEVFSIIGSVRNDGYIEPIDACRGVPEDSCQFIQDMVAANRDWTHSLSYVTLAELLEYLADHPKVVRAGMISPEQAARLDNEGITPTSWCKWTNAADYVQREWEDENSIVYLIGSIVDRIQLFDRWRTKEQIMEDGANIRIVFYFDS